MCPLYGQRKGNSPAYTGYWLDTNSPQKKGKTAGHLERCKPLATEVTKSLRRAITISQGTGQHICDEKSMADLTPPRAQFPSLLSQCLKVVLALEIWAMIGAPMFLSSRGCGHPGPKPWRFHGTVEFLRAPADIIGVSYFLGEIKDVGGCEDDEDHSNLMRRELEAQATG